MDEKELGKSGIHHIRMFGSDGGRDHPRVPVLHGNSWLMWFGENVTDIDELCCSVSLSAHDLVHCKISV